MRRSTRPTVFWQEELRLAFVEQEKIYKEIQYYLWWQRKKNPSYQIQGGGVFICVCMSSFKDRDKFKLIKLQRKMKQLKSSKIPYFLERIVSSQERRS